jgi:hypothetical protein
VGTGNLLGWLRAAFLEPMDQATTLAPGVDNGMKITTGDITPSDGAHLTIAGLHKQAALEWRVLGLDR